MRRFALVIALLLGALTLAACSSDDHNSSSSGHGSSNSSEHGMGSDGEVETNRPVISGAPEVVLTADALSFTPKTLQLAAGQSVNIALTSVDLEHDLFVKGIGHVAHAEAGETTKAGLKIDRSGTYQFWCTIRGHKAGGMVGTVTVS